MVCFFFPFAIEFHTFVTKFTSCVSGYSADYAARKESDDRTRGRARRQPTGGITEIDRIPACEQEPVSLCCAAEVAGWVLLCPASRGGVVVALAVVVEGRW